MTMNLGNAAPRTPPFPEGIVVAWDRDEAGREAPDTCETRPIRSGVTVAVCTLSRPDSLRRLLGSLAIQTRRPEQLVIVDASPGADSEEAIREVAAAGRLADRVSYARVAAPLVGLTRQRNLALKLAERDLVAFFDDDIVLDPACLAEQERAHRGDPARVVGVGGRVITPLSDGLTALWRLRRLLRIVPSLRPGLYCRSGMSTPWWIPEGTEGFVAGDWLPGYAMMWKTSLARDLGFDESFAGYGQAEDLEFSLRAARHGSLLMACGARVLHDQAPAGRPDPYRRGYMGIRNRYRVHRIGIRPRRWVDAAWFAYAWSLDTLLLGRQLLFPSRWKATVLEAAGRMRAGYDIVTKG